MNPRQVGTGFDASVLAILPRREMAVDLEMKIADFVVLLGEDGKKE